MYVYMCISMQHIFTQTKCASRPLKFVGSAHPNAYYMHTYVQLNGSPCLRRL